MVRNLIISGVFRNKLIYIIILEGKFVIFILLKPVLSKFEEIENIKKNIQFSYTISGILPVYVILSLLFRIRINLSQFGILTAPSIFFNLITLI